MLVVVRGLLHVQFCQTLCRLRRHKGVGVPSQGRDESGARARQDALCTNVDREQNKHPDESCGSKHRGKTGKQSQRGPSYPIEYASQCCENETTSCENETTDAEESTRPPRSRVSLT